MKTVDFLETFSAVDLKVGRYTQQIELIEIYKYSRSRLFLYPGPRSFTYEN